MPLFLPHISQASTPSQGRTPNPLLFPQLSLRVAKSGFQDRQPKALPGSLTITTFVQRYPTHQGVLAYVCRRLALSFTAGPRAVLQNPAKCRLVEVCEARPRLPGKGNGGSQFRKLFFAFLTHTHTSVKGKQDAQADCCTMNGYNTVCKYA